MEGRGRLATLWVVLRGMARYAPLRLSDRRRLSHLTSRDSSLSAISRDIAMIRNKVRMESKSAEEIDRAVDNVRGALEPYLCFVRSEHTKVKERASTLNGIRERLRLLKHEIESLVLIR